MLDYCLRVCYNLLALVVDKPGACTTMQSFLDAFNAWRAAVRPVQPMGFALDFSQVNGGVFGAAVLKGDLVPDAELFHRCRQECEAWLMLVACRMTERRVAMIAANSTTEQKKLYYGFAYIAGLSDADISDLSESGLILRPAGAPAGFDFRAWGDSLREALRYVVPEVEAESEPTAGRMVAAGVVALGFLYGVISAVGDVLRLLGE